MYSEKEMVKDFQIWPPAGDKRLPVGIAMRRKSNYKKLICDFGDKSTPEKDKLVINYVYKKVGIFDGKIQVYENELDEKPKQEIPFTVTVKEPPEIKFIGTVGLKKERAIAYEDQVVQFVMTHPRIPNSAAFDDISWDFGNREHRSSGKIPNIAYKYKKAECYTVTVTAKMKRFDPERGEVVIETDSKSCHIMVLPKSYSLKF